MNFQNLISKIGELDKPVTQLKEQAEFKFSNDMDLNAVKKLSGLSESEVAECGGMMGGMMGSPSTPPVTMNVSINASGTENIRDLMDLLQGVDGEKGDAVAGPVGVISVSGDDHDEPDADNFGGPSDNDADNLDIEVDEIAGEIDNAPNEKYGSVSDMTDAGSNDGRGDNEAEKVNGGGNPYDQVSEGLMTQLQNLYTEIKNR